jgi:hypothetical protein
MNQSIPEPPPKDKGFSIPCALINFIESSCSDEDIKREAIHLITMRDRFGRAKYGQPLMSEDGRDCIEDAMQEIGDLMQYVFKAKCNGRDLEPIRKMMTVALIILEEK